MAAARNFGAVLLGLVAFAAACDAVAAGEGVSVPLTRVATAPLGRRRASASAAAVEGGSGTVVPLKGGYAKDGFYYSPIEVGTPPVTFNVLIDTGSSQIGLPSAVCKSCGDGKGPRYNYQASTTAQPVACGSQQCEVCTTHGGTPGEGACDFGKPYCSSVVPDLCGYGYAYGGGESFLTAHLVTDTVTFGGLTLNTTIAASDGQWPAGSFEGLPPNGILGLGYDANACNPTCVPTIFTQLVEAGLVPANRFGLCLDGEAGGVLDLGFFDEAKYSKAALQWVPVVQERWYNLPLRDITFNDTTIGLPPMAYSYLNDQIGSFIDSGTTAMLFGPLQWKHIIDTWQADFCHLPGVCGAAGTTIFDGQCLTAEQAKQLPSFPDFEFHFEGEGGANDPVVLTVASDFYFVPGGDDGSMCLDAGSAVGISAVLGDSFMASFYIAHDRVNQRVGFAPIDKCA